MAMHEQYGGIRPLENVHAGRNKTFKHAHVMSEVFMGQHTETLFAEGEKIATVYGKYIIKESSKTSGSTRKYIDAFLALHDASIRFKDWKVLEVGIPYGLTFPVFQSHKNRDLDIGR